VDQGNSVIVIEHNLDVIKTADHIIDIGPEGGDGGGQIVAEGTPEEIAKVKKSYTGHYLADMLGETKKPAKAKKRQKRRSQRNKAAANGQTWSLKLCPE
ncbi:MAG: hypothetical protein ABJC64_08925, partial [Paracoccaceae bacterium]